MAAPMLVLPFITSLFWALGGGEGLASEGSTQAATGLNFEIPAAHFSEEDLDKLSLYEKARRDSLKFQEARDNDPYFRLDELELSDAKTLASRKPATGSSDPNEILVTSKLDELYRELNRKPGDLLDERKSRSDKSISSDRNGSTTHGSQASEDLQQLNAMMEGMQSRRKNSADPEEVRINSMLDKILDIQHPERVGSRGQDRKAGSETLTVSTTSPELQGDFLGLIEERILGDSSNSIEAVVHNTQELVAGSTVKMRLLRDVFIDGHLIEKDRFIFGTAAINGERLLVSVTSLRSESSLYAVKLDAYDLDGLQGIYVPGAITRDAAKQSSDQAMQSMQFMTMDQSLGAQAGAAGVQAAKGLFSKKVKLVRVTVKAGYRILLRDSHG